MHACMLEMCGSVLEKAELTVKFVNGFVLAMNLFLVRGNMIAHPNYGPWGHHE